MAFLRTLFWVVLAVILVVFSLRNWVPVTLNLFGDLQADVKLPVLLLIAFLVGFAPLFVWHRTTIWRHRRAPSAVRPTVARSSTATTADSADGSVFPARAD